MSDINISRITKDRLESYLEYVPGGEIPEILAGKAIVLGIDDGDTPVGAVAAGYGHEPDDGPGDVLVIKNLHLIEKYRNQEVLKRVTGLVNAYAADEKLAGTVWKILYPDNKALEKVLKPDTERLLDGNTIYEAFDNKDDEDDILRSLKMTEAHTKIVDNAKKSKPEINIRTFTYLDQRLMDQTPLKSLINNRKKKLADKREELH